MAIADSGYTSHFFPLTDQDKCVDVRKVRHTVGVTLPDSMRIHSTKEGMLPFQNLSAQGRATAFFPHLRAPLVSLTVAKDDNVILEAH